MPLSPSDSTLDLALLSTFEPGPTAHAAIEQDVQLLFDQCGPPLLRYVASFGLSADETEDVVQDVFLALFRHLYLRRSRSNLKGWLFQVAHNLALRHRKRAHRRWARHTWDDAAAARHVDPSPSPEERLVKTQRQQLLQSVLHTLPERDRRCLHLRAEGLRYRDIAKVLGISLGAVAKSLTRSVTRLVSLTEE